MELLATKLEMAEGEEGCLGCQLDTHVEMAGSSFVPKTGVQRRHECWGNAFERCWHLDGL